MDIDFPLQFDARGLTATVGRDAHVRDMIEQLIFTNHGERVNRPEFGSGLQQLIFAPNSPELATALQFAMQSALQRFLGDVIDVANLEVESRESTLRVLVQYVVRGTSETQAAVFTRTV